MITAIIFDLDGTLLNTLDDLHASVCHALCSIGASALTKSDTRRLLGNGAKNLIYKSVEQVVADADVAVKEQALAAFRTHYQQHSMDNTVPYDGIVEMLADCRERGLLTAIVSNKPNSAVLDLHRRFFADTISFAVGETADVRRKPAPDMVLQAMNALSQHGDLAPANCLYVGDSEVDIATAHAAGMPCVAVSWGFRDRDMLEQSGAEHIIDSPVQLMNLVDKL